MFCETNSLQHDLSSLLCMYHNLYTDQHLWHVATLCAVQKHDMVTLSVSEAQLPAAAANLQDLVHMHLSH